MKLEIMYISFLNILSTRIYNIKVQLPIMVTSENSGAATMD